MVEKITNQNPIGYLLYFNAFEKLKSKIEKCRNNISKINSENYDK